MHSRHCTTASCSSSTTSARSPVDRIDAVDALVVDLDLEVLRPAAVAAQPGMRPHRFLHAPQDREASAARAPPAA